jgi:prevent-host-death family protein
MVMIMVNIFEAKAKLSEYVEAATRGERVLICKRNRPVAELRAVEDARTEPRPVGLAKGKLEVPATFFEPLPAAIEAGFYGFGEEETGGRPSQAAEHPPPYGSSRKGRRR